MDLSTALTIDVILLPLSWKRVIRLNLPINHNYVISQFQMSNDEHAADIATKDLNLITDEINMIKCWPDLHTRYINDKVAT